jgi:hypothetical protein
MHYLFDDNFPDPELADETGLLAVGGNLSPETLINAYQLKLNNKNKDL